MGAGPDVQPRGRRLDGAFATPFKWTKQMASHFGGTRNGMCVSWPARIKDAGGVRHQFHHVVDVMPTLLEAAGVPAPVSVNGIAHRPVEGVSTAYTWDGAAAASRRRTQYFVMFANRALYHDGWVACTTPTQAPWVLAADAPPDVLTGYQWELYDVATDWTQNRDLAKANPAKLRELEDQFLVEAAKYQVLPLDNSKLTRMVAQRPSLVAGRDTFTHTRPIAGTPHGDAPRVLNRSYRFKWQAKDALPPGRDAVEFDFTYDDPGKGKGGTGVLKVDGKAVATQTVPATAAGEAAVGGETTEGKHEGLYDRIAALPARTDAQRAAQAQAVKTAVDIGQARWQLYAHRGSSIPPLFVGVLVFWLVMLHASAAVVSPPNRTAVTAHAVSALAVSTALFLVLELDRPFQGVIEIPSTPLRNALAQMGK